MASTTIMTTTPAAATTTSTMAPSVINTDVEDLVQVEHKSVIDEMGHAGMYSGPVDSNGMPHGDHGTMQYADNNPSIVSYQGSWNHGHWQYSGKCYLKNGDVYEGQFYKSERHGNGEYTWKVQEPDYNASTEDTITKQRIYQGTFQHNQRQGHGKYIWKTMVNGKDISTSTYVGMFDDGLRQGHGVYTSPKLTYTGEWWQGSYHGYGVLEFANGGNTYKGYFFKGKKQGRGTEIKTDGTVIHDGQWADDKPAPKQPVAKKGATPKTESSSSLSSVVFSTPKPLADGEMITGQYRGIVEDGLPQGVGTMTYPTDPGHAHPAKIVQYDGFWQKGIRHGFGRCQFLSGDMYVGNFVMGEPQGAGTYTTQLGSHTFKGRFQNGKPDGPMRVVYGNNHLYEGDYVKGLRHGSNGQFLFLKENNYDKGSSYKGSFVNGLYHEQGTLITNQTSYMGNFKEGKYHGKGCLKLLEDDSILYQGEWDNGVPTDNNNNVRIKADHLYIPQPPTDPKFCSENTCLPSKNSVVLMLDKLKAAKEKVKNNNLSVTAGDVTANNKKDEEACKAVVDISVSDGQDNPGKYTGIMHIPSQRPHGVGRMVYNDGNRIHEGFWEYGHRQGHGRCLFVQIGDYHEGKYHQNLRHGPGKYLWKDGRQFIGTYVNDERHGEGKFLYPNGDMYQGNFTKGQRDGFGVFIFGNKTCEYHGNWVKGVYAGKGKLQWRTSNGTETRVYEGDFEQGLFHGTGKESSLDLISGETKMIREGTWIKGKYQAVEEENEAAIVEDDGEEESPKEGNEKVETEEEIVNDTVEDESSKKPEEAEAEPTAKTDDPEVTQAD